MALPVNGSTHLIPAYYSIYRPRKDEGLSWPKIGMQFEIVGYLLYCTAKCQAVE